MLAAIIVWLAALLWCVPQQSLEQPIDPNAQFQRQLERARANPNQANWSALRLAFSRTNAYNPNLEPFDPSPIYHELNNGERVAALVALDRALDGRWVEPEPHFHAALIYDQLGETDRRDLHLAFGRGLRQAIIQAADGHSFQTAYPILVTSEEPYILRHLGLTGPARRSQLLDHGRHFDIHTFNTPAGGEIQVFFDIETAWQASNRRQNEHSLPLPGLSR